MNNRNHSQDTALVSRRKRKGKLPITLWGTVLGLLALLTICILVAMLIYFPYRARLYNSRPLVLIHDPLNNDQADVGEGVIVHATARADNGLARMELWVDDNLIAARDAPESAPTNLVLSANWTPTLAGDHILIVRAISKDRVDGQATVRVVAVESGQSGTGTHIVAEGETLESIASDHSASVDELSELNPDLGLAGSAPGDELVAPDPEPPVDDEPAGPAPGDEPVVPDPEPPADDEPVDPAPGDEPVVPDPEPPADDEPVDPAPGDEPVVPDPELPADDEPAGPAPDDELIVPDFEPSADDEPAPVDDEGSEPPSAEDDAPGSLNLIGEILGLGPLDIFGEDETEQVTLRLEIPMLRAGDGSCDGLHCYIELAGSPPLWYPDADNDQSTDESFARLDHGWWDSSAHLEGNAAPVIVWPSNQPLPLDVSCVGVTAGGTDALELGRVELSIPPEDWDGVSHDAEASGAEGHYYFSYRVTRLDSAPRAIPIWLDPNMNSPVNARLDDRRNSLRWDYNPEPDEEPIDGFRVYLNGNLQWVEPADSRESGLPYEWFNPPCGTTYTFAVTAFRIGFPDGPESLPAIAIISQPVEDCTREILIIFQTLETYDLGGDGRYEDRHGDIGPPYGHFFANEKQITFDTRSSRDREGRLDMPNGLTHNTIYDLSEMSADMTWGFSGMNSTIVDVPPGGSFEFGFHIMDEDTGRCRDSDDRGCDDLICEGLSGIHDDNIYGDFDDWHEGSLLSDNGRCRVAFRWGPAFGSPVGSGEPGWEPLPWLEMTDFSVDTDTGQVQIEIRNTGRATWPWKDLNIELQTRAGETIGVYTWPGFMLETGQSTTLEHPDMVLDAPFDACVVIDPFDEVLEEYERSGMLVHNPICPRLPDLSIVNAYYASSGGGRLRVTVQNVGDAPLENRTLALETLLPDGSPLYLAASWPNISLEPREMRTFDLSGVSESVRARMQAGYSVTVDPDETIIETNRENNTYFIRGTSTILLRWCTTAIPHYYGYGYNARLDLTASAITGSGTRSLLTHHIDYNFSYHYIYSHDIGYPIGEGICINLGTFEILGDEQLQVTIAGEYQAGNAGGWDDLSAGTGIFLPEDNWGAAITTDCSSYDYHFFDTGVGWQHYRVYPNLSMLSPTPWSTNFHLCLEEIGP